MTKTTPLFEAHDLGKIVDVILSIAVGVTLSTDTFKM